MKRCPSCMEVKSLRQFYKNAARPDGRQAQCIQCQRAYRDLIRDTRTEVRCGTCAAAAAKRVAVDQR